MSVENMSKLDEALKPAIDDVTASFPPTADTQLALASLLLSYSGSIFSYILGPRHAAQIVKLEARKLKKPIQ